MTDIEIPVALQVTRVDEYFPQPKAKFFQTPIVAGSRPALIDTDWVVASRMLAYVNDVRRANDQSPLTTGPTPDPFNRTYHNMDVVWLRCANVAELYTHQLKHVVDESGREDPYYGLAESSPAKATRDSCGYTPATRQELRPALRDAEGKIHAWPTSSASDRQYAKWLITSMLN